MSGSESREREKKKKGIRGVCNKVVEEESEKSTNHKSKNIPLWPCVILFYSCKRLAIKFCVLKGYQNTVKGAFGCISAPCSPRMFL